MRIALHGAIYELANVIKTEGYPQTLILAHEIDGVPVEGTSAAEVLSALADYLQGKIIPGALHQLYYEQALFLVNEALSMLNKIEWESEDADKIAHFTTTTMPEAAAPVIQHFDNDDKEVRHRWVDDHCTKNAPAPDPEQKNAGYDRNYDVAFDRKVNDASTEGPAL